MHCDELVEKKRVPFCIRGGYGRIKHSGHKNFIRNKVEQTFAVVVDDLLDLLIPSEWDKVVMESNELLCELLVLLVRLGVILDVKDRDRRRSFEMFSFAFAFVVSSVWILRLGVVVVNIILVEHLDPRLGHGS